MIGRLMTLTTVALPRVYAFKEEAPEKAEDWGRRLWSLLQAHVGLPSPTGIRQPEEFTFISERLTNYLLARLLTRSVVASAEVKGLPREELDRRLVEIVDDVLDVSEHVRDEVVWYLDKICDRIEKGGSELTDAQRRRILASATAAAHRCYMCGQELSYPDRPHPDDPPGNVKNDRGFEIDHIFPGARGGSRHPGNLGACCSSCNRFKMDRLSFVDILLEAAITSSVSPETIRRLFGSGPMVLALLWRQDARCAMCSKKFHDSADERLILQRRDEQDVFHFLNVQLICGNCGDSGMAGVLIRE